MSNLKKEDLETFALTANGFFGLKQTEQIDYLIYFLTITKGHSTTNASLIRECFLLLDLLPYSNISQYLTNNLKSKDKTAPKFIRIKSGYQLHRDTKIAIENSLVTKPLKAVAKTSLKSLLAHINNPNENDFLKEAISCVEIEAYRAAVIMTWNLALDHLTEFIMVHELPAFNAILSKNTDKRIKILSVTKKDDFSEIPEGKLIEFCKSANIITGDVRKVLDIKLGIRNTYAHPSSLKLSETKAVEFIEDLVNNIILKYTV